MTLYRYCGWLLDSDCDLGTFAPIADNPCDSVSIVIRRACLPDSLPKPHQVNAVWSHNQQEALWQLAGVVRYHIREQGRRIDWEPLPGADPADIGLFLLRAVLPLAALMRGEFLLNGSAVARNGQATAFIGPSASGKSTAAALLIQRGSVLLADSLIRIDRHQDGPLMIYPQAPGLWLWPNAIRQLGWQDQAQQPVRAGLNLQQLAFAVAHDPVPLHRMAILREQKGDDLELFEPEGRQGAQAFELLLHRLAANTWTEELADRHRLFAWAIGLSQQARIERLDIPWGFDQLSLLGDRLDHWSSQ
jgi:hypothetical protein